MSFDASVFFVNIFSSPVDLCRLSSLLNFRLSSADEDEVVLDRDFLTGSLLSDEECCLYSIKQYHKCL